ncbi:DUF4422 domain-containing protein [Herbaspirillum sp. RV1423]|uniref:DUF4422 domain-containing protein n=1 Tax=Herbaspirillum sp. RV1423 TaxID=1443993 RepID=UPI0004AEE690|nr:DUF4422 domain-containing protein [Herbaspirillum sp. RV1423]
MNTINVCIGHLPFPERHAHFIDLAISPNVITGGAKRRAIVPDDIYGENGHALSEYAQLLWLYKNIDAIASNFEYVNISHYRRFVSPEPVDGTKASNGPWITTIQESDMGKYASCFDRTNSISCFNTPVHFSDGVVSQYATAHVLEDFLNFVKYLMEIEMFSPVDAAKFLRYQDIIPACSVGIYQIEIFKKLYLYLERASGFMNSSYFVVRDGYQRRSMGFLLERLHSFLILELLRNMGKFGQNMMISESHAVTSTTGRVS